MNLQIEQIKLNAILTGDIKKDVENLLNIYGCSRIAEHSRNVAEQSKILALKFNYDLRKAEIAGYLHDISGIIPNSERVNVAEKLNIEILKEEREFPLILHQKISGVISKEVFKIDDVEIINAISCHTTLKKEPSKLDLILFVADKIAWDQEGKPPYINEVLIGIDSSLEQGAYEYIKYLIDRKEELKVVHPILIDAYEFLKREVSVMNNHIVDYVYKIVEDEAKKDKSFIDSK
ncbi:MAG TPA: HAD family hydrolase [Clostridiales bacterium]|nr:MAG: hypothetical protein A2Y18_07490 [Clostridiales bacterium GWD2_32_19]HCC06843.1 HAD family hydrolase [Clostridiales bacterium]